MHRHLLLLALLVACSASAQNPPAERPRAAAPPSRHAKLMVEQRYDLWSDDGTGSSGLVARIYDDGTVEYSADRAGNKIRSGNISPGVIAHLGAILNSPGVRSLKPAYPAFDGWGFTAIRYDIRFFSGTVERTIVVYNVLPIRKGHRDEYPTPLLRLVCALADIHNAVVPQKDTVKRGDCNEFPEMAQPNMQVGTGER